VTRLGFEACPQNCEMRLLDSSSLSVCLSVRPSAWNSRLSLDGFSFEFDILGFFQTLWRKFKFRYHLTRVAGTLHEDVCTYVTVSC